MGQFDGSIDNWADVLKAWHGSAAAVGLHSTLQQVCLLCGLVIQSAMQTMYLISDSASAPPSRQGALRLNSRPLSAALFARRTGIRSGIACRGTIQRMRHPVAVLDSGGSNGSGSNGAGQHHSIQHPLFPDVQQAAVGPLPVRTQRGLPLFSPMIGNPPCPSCAGTGKTTCGDCRQAAEGEVAGIS